MSQASTAASGQRGHRPESRTHSSAPRLPAQWPVLILVLLTAWMNAVRAAAPDPLDDGAILTAEYPGWFLESFLNLQDDLENAAANGKQGLIVVFSTAGCSYCHRLAEETLKNPLVAERLQRDFDALALEIFSDDFMITPQGEEMAIKTFARQLGADFTPAVYFFDLQGQPRLRLVGFTPPDRFLSALRYVPDGHYQDGRFRDFLAAERDAAGAAGSPDIPDDPLFASPPHMLQRSAAMPSDRPLMVVFDGPDCDECPYLYGTLFKDPALRAQLEQMDVVRLSTDKNTPLITPDGQRTRARDWHAELGLHRTPALVFFEPAGRLVMQSDAQMLRQRLDNTLGYVLEKAYLEGISYQRFARRRAIARTQPAASDANE